MSTLPLLLLLLAGGAAARPCKTIFYFSAITTTTSYYPYDSLIRNPIPNPLLHKPRYFTLVFTTTTTTTTPSSQLSDHRPSINFDSDNPFDSDSDSSSDSSPTVTSSSLPIRFYSSVSNSIRERTRDIMSVVGAMLFGVACGALTAATMYFVWALFSPSRFDFDDVSSSDDDDDDGYDDDVAAAKKFGYVTIPTKPEVVDDDLKKQVPVAKEVV